MSKKAQRRRFSSVQKAAILKQHLVDNVVVSDLCEEHGIYPSQFYNWQRQLLDNLPAALEAASKPKTNARETKLEKKVAALEVRLSKKDSVIAEISEEYVTLKKALGEL